MTDPTLSSSTPWDDSSWQLLQEAMDRLIEAWHSDSEPVLSDFVPVPPEDPRFAKMVLHLIETDYECRRKAGKTKEAEDYAGDFPQLLADPEWVRAVEEVVGGGDGEATADSDGDAGGDWGRRPGDSWRRPEALRVLCPNPDCRRLLDLAGEEVAAKMACPGCGHQFRLGDAGVPIKTMPDDRVRPKRRIAHFELLEQLGTGTFGTVWKAWDTQLKRTVAIKLPKAGQIGVDVERFFREAEAAAQLEHPNIVSVYGEGQEEGVLYIVTSYVEGANLKRWREKHELSVRDAVSLCATIADALDYAHAQGIVHRDVKPENILMDADGEPHIADFGLAKMVDQQATMSASGNFMGSPAYMSPEQAKGESHKADGRSDVCSLGVILYELLTSVLPFRDRDLFALLKRIIEEEPTSIRTLDSQLPRDLETICGKCLEKDPSRRYQTAGELAAELRRFLNNEPILARPIGWPEKTWRWCRREPMTASALGALFVVMLVGMVVSSALAFSWRQEAARATEAEQKTQQESAARESESLRRLADRGDWQSVIRGLDSPAITEYGDPTQVRLWRIEALNALNRYEEAIQAVEQLAKEEVPDEYKGQFLLWHGDVLRLRGDMRWMDLVRESLTHNLSDADTAYAKALLAPTLLEAIPLLEKVVELEPFHQRANTLLPVSLLLTGNREQARSRAAAATYFFPEDPNFPMVLIVVATIEEDEEAVERGLAQVEGLMGQAELERFRAILKQIHTAREILTGDMDLKTLVSNLSSLVMAQSSSYIPASAGNQTNFLRMPPQVSKVPWLVIEILKSWTLGAVIPAQREATLAAVAEVAQTIPITAFRAVHGALLLESGRVEEAAEILTAAIQPEALQTHELIPGARRQALTWAVLAHLRLYQAHLDDERGEEHFKKALPLLVEYVQLDNPPPPFLDVPAGILLQEKHAVLEVHQALERVHARQPGKNTTLLAWSHQIQGNHYRAWQLAEEALHANPKDGQAQKIRDACLAILDARASSEDKREPSPDPSDAEGAKDAKPAE